MTDYESTTNEVKSAVDDLQQAVRDKVQMMRETFAVIDGDEPWPDGSSEAEAFAAGVEGGMACMMQVLHDRGWLRVGGGGR